MPGGEGCDGVMFRALKKGQVILGSIQKENDKETRLCATLIHLCLHEHALLSFDDNLPSV